MQRNGEAYAMKYQQVAYDVAQKIPGVLYQMPCYCYCDRIGHNSLRTCFEICTRSPLRNLHERSLLRLLRNEEG